MCRSIRQLRRVEPGAPATTGEATAAALQYVRKVSGTRVPSARHRDAFEAAVAEVTGATARLLAALGTDVVDGPDPFADPVTRRAILDARDARHARNGRGTGATAAGRVSDASGLAKSVRGRSSSANLEASRTHAMADTAPRTAKADGRE